MQSTSAVIALLDPFAAASQGAGSGPGVALDLGAVSGPGASTDGVPGGKADAPAADCGQFGDALAAAMAAAMTAQPVVQPAPQAAKATDSAGDIADFAHNQSAAPVAPAMLIAQQTVSADVYAVTEPAPSMAAPNTTVDIATPTAPVLVRDVVDKAPLAREPAIAVGPDVAAPNLAIPASAAPATIVGAEPPKVQPAATAPTIEPSSATPDTKLAAASAAPLAEAQAPSAPRAPAAQMTPVAPPAVELSVAPPPTPTPAQAPAAPIEAAPVTLAMAAPAEPATPAAAEAQAVQAAVISTTPATPAARVATSKIAPGAEIGARPAKVRNGPAPAEARGVAQTVPVDAQAKPAPVVAAGTPEDLPLAEADEPSTSAETDIERPALAAASPALVEQRSVHSAAADAPRATPQTVALLAAQIANKVDGKSTRFDVQLDPHGLGKVDVRVEISARGEVSAALTFENPQAASELRGKAGELQTALEQAGFDLSKTSLSFNSGGQGQHQGLFDQQPQNQQPVWRGRAFADLSDTPETAPAPVLRRAAAGGVDVRI